MSIAAIAALASTACIASEPDASEVDDDEATEESSDELKNGYRFIKEAAKNACISSKGGNEGEVVLTSTCGPNHDQHGWILTNGRLQSSGGGSAVCLSAGSATAGTIVRDARCDTKDNSVLWYFGPVETIAGVTGRRLRSRKSNLCMATLRNNESLDTQVRVQLQGCVSSPKQLWTFVAPPQPPPPPPTYWRAIAWGSCGYNIWGYHCTIPGPGTTLQELKLVLEDQKVGARCDTPGRYGYAGPALPQIFSNPPVTRLVMRCQ
ncbi:MAG: RICIN domain-containing protein [Deltaproteobacteria bacterium]|nr:RICIN domain-containing protein [Deltaproteobacteria bacterium]